MSALDEQRVAGETPDAFIALLLGARARLRCGEARLLEAAAARDAAPDSSQPHGDTVLFAALGWIALARDLECWIAKCVNDAESEIPSPARQAHRGAGLLR